MTDMLETKFLPVDLKAGKMSDDGRYREIEGYGAVFGNVDSYNEIIEPGAFAASIAVKEPKMAWQDEYREDANGLMMRGRIATRTERGADAVELLEMGALKGLSIGFNTVRSEMNHDNGVRRLLEIDLWEVSLVSVPANPLANVTGFKSIETTREFEAALRKMGFSRSDAKCIASHGFTAWAGQRDAGDNAEMVEAQREVAALANSLKQALKGL
jgi:HK97 family phage prohead protease